MNRTYNYLRAKAACATGLALLLSGFAVSAQAQKPVARIVNPVDNGARATLAGSRPALLQGATDGGPMDRTTQFKGVTLTFSRSAAQDTALDTLITAQQDPSSPQYHQWLSPDQFAAQFGAADSDLTKVQTWLQGQGFAIDEVSRNRTAIRFSGNVAQIEAAFGTQMHNFTVGSEKHFAPATDLTIPAAFSAAVMAVGNLSDFRPHANVKMLKPAFTSAQSASHFVAPKDVATIYDINSAYNTGWTGVGQSITVIGQSAIVLSDISNFQTASGVPVRPPNLIVMANSGVSTVYAGDEAESDLDLEYTSAIARGATINFVYTGNSPTLGAFDAMGYAITNKIGTIISISYGSCETAFGLANYNTYNAFLQQAAAQGQTVVTAAGDQGSSDCYTETGTSLTAAQLGGASADFPAVSPFVTGMGGTEYLAADVVSTNTTYWLSTTGIDARSSALSYIPEMVWNDSAVASGLSAGGGGVSAFAARPTWQVGVPGIPAGTFRLVPDVSLASSPNNAGYLYCSSDTSTGITGSCTNGFRDVNSTNLTIAGGTSFAAPIFAGMLAIIGQSKNATTGQGLINPTLYTLASNATTYSTAFHDIVTGTNACTNGSSYALTFSSAGAVTSYGPACAAGGLYAATTGYDEATGLGSVDLNNLLTAWPGTTAALPAEFTLSAAAVTLTAGTTGTASITITPVRGYTGTINLTLSGNPLVTYACFTTASGAVSGTTAATTTVTIYTTATNCTTGAQPLSTGGTVTTAAAKTPAKPTSPRLPVGIAMAGLFAIGFAGRRSQRLRGLVMVAMLAIAGFGLSGCGSSAAGTGLVGTGTTTTTTTTGVAAKGTYNVAVTGVDATTGQQATTSFTLTLQ